MSELIPQCNRRSFLRSSTMIGMAACSERLLPAFALGSQHQEPKFEYSDIINLEISEAKITIGEATSSATAINGTVPGPLVRLREGTDAVLRVSNRLPEDSSIHWHGLILPFRMDGVPGLSFDGIRPGETFEYRFPVTQNGTYWYHSHSGLQEQTGVYGPLVVDPIDREPWSYDREYVVMLSDWTFEDPHRLMAKIKKQADYSNFQQRTLKEFYANVRDRGFLSTARERLMWSKMRMMASDIADVTGYRYTYLMNGQAPSSNWQALFHPGERVRLRFINAAAMTYFDIRIPGLSMKVVQADGQNVQPVVVDEFRISVAETYDVIVEPKSDQAYTIFAETMDRSGFARGTLAPRSGMSAAIPRRRKRPTLTMMDMGMEMKGMQGMQMKANAVAEEPESQMEGMTQPPSGHGDQRMAMQGMHHETKPETRTFRHGPETHGPGNTSVATISRSRLHEPGLGLENASHRVLVYTDLKSSDIGVDQRIPRREIELHLTGNMERYMWSFDGEQFSKRTEPIRLVYGERVRLTFVNDTMMNHPIHLHGMWMVLDNGNGVHNPRKHTINVKPAERLSADVTVDAPGNWAFHCHLIFHMDMGMFRVVSVSKPTKKDLANEPAAN